MERVCTVKESFRRVEVRTGLDWTGLDWTGLDWTVEFDCYYIDTIELKGSQPRRKAIFFETLQLDGL